MLNHHKLILLFTKFISFYGLFLMRKSFNYEIIFYEFQILLRNSLDPDPDSGVYWIRIEIFGWIRVQ